MSLVNSQTDLDEVRYNLGKTASSNVSDAEIDKALIDADDQVLEDTGFNTSSDPAYEKPGLIHKLKILNATAYLLIRFADKVELRNSILGEITRNNKKITNPEPEDTDDETIITGVNYDTYPLNPAGGFYKPTSIKNNSTRSLYTTKSGGEGSNYMGSGGV